MSNTLITGRRDNRHEAESLAARTSHPPGPPQQAAQALQNRSARTALPDRVAMWIGLKLLLWGTRPEARDAEAIDRRDLREALAERAIREHRAALERARAASGLTAYTGQFGR